MDPTGEVAALALARENWLPPLGSGAEGKRRFAMTARKKSGRKQPARKARTRRSATLTQLEHELPPTLREYAKRVRRRLNQLEKQIEKAQVQARRRGARLLREASHELGKLHVGGEAGWRRLATSYRRELVALLRRLEKGVAPPAPRKPARKAAVRKATTRGRASARGALEPAGERTASPPPAGEPAGEPQSTGAEESPAEPGHSM